MGGNVNGNWWVCCFMASMGFLFYGCVWSCAPASTSWKILSTLGNFLPLSFYIKIERNDVLIPPFVTYLWSNYCPSGNLAIVLLFGDDFFLHLWQLIITGFYNSSWLKSFNIGMIALPWSPVNWHFNVWYIFLRKNYTNGNKVSFIANLVRFRQ